VAQTLERDPAATAKILQVVNSASAGTSRRISDITQAVSLLGLRNVRALVLMHDLVHDFHPTTIAGVDWVGHLAGHSVETSRLARLLSDGAPWADDAFAGGLLLDIGQLVLAWCRPDAFSQHYLAWHHREGALADIEARTFGVDHAAAGAYLLSLWGLSFNVIQAAAEHARSTAPPDLTGPVGAVIAAHRIVEAELGPVCGPRDGGPPVDEEQFDPAIRKRLARWRADLHREGTEPVDD
jgi:HD-like signal output (HDOD) protein